MPEECDRQGASNDLAHQRAFLALVAQLDGRLLLHVAHPLLKRSKPPTSLDDQRGNLTAGEALLQLIPERHPLLAAQQMMPGVSSFFLRSLKGFVASGFEKAICEKRAVIGGALPLW